MDINEQSRNLQLVTNHIYAGKGSDNNVSQERYSRAPLHSDGVHLVKDGDVTSGAVSSFQ